MSDMSVILTSVLSSGALATAISFSFGESKERWALRRSKIEEIYLSAAGWLAEANATFFPFRSVCDGSLSYDQANDINIKKIDKTKGELRLKMKMNIEMYERSLIPPMRKMEEELEKLNKLQIAIRKHYADHGEARNLLRPFTIQLLVFDQSGNALLEAITQRGVEIGSEPGQLRNAIDCGINYASHWWSRLKAAFGVN